VSEPTDGRTWEVRTANAGDLPFIHDGELGYIREREPAQEAAWLAAVERNRALWTANLDRTTVDPATRARLAALLADDVRDLQGLLGRRLTMWPTAAHAGGGA
jgi:hypothetical protein